VTEALVCRRIVRSGPDLPAAIDVLRQLRPQLDAAVAATRIEEQERDHGYELHGCFRAGQLLAVAGFRPVQTLARGKHLHLDDLVTLEAERGNGIGSALLRHIEAEARSRSLGAVFLDARPDAITFYERRGYEPHTAPLYRKRLAP
jgi:GNAT superfamily N-acetyltransferase